MARGVLLALLGAEVLFLGSGALLLAVSMVFKNINPAAPGSMDEATALLLQMTPLTGALANAVIIFVTFLLAIPGILQSKDRRLLRLHSWGLLFCALISLGVGLEIWATTLQTRSNIGSMFGTLPQAQQSALQAEFQCCGYLVTGPFITDAVCRDAFTAQRLGPCVGPFSSYANNVLDIVFTAMFGVTAVDAFAFLATIVMLKHRAEQERYRLIDVKNGFGGI